MLRTKDFNNISEEDLNKLAPVDMNRIYNFEFIHKTDDPNNPGKILMPAAKRVTPIQRIMVNGKPTDIALIAYIEPGGKVVFDDLYFERRSRGNLVLDPNNPNDYSRIQFLLLSNEFVDKEGRPSNVAGMYRLVDHGKEALAKRRIRKQAHQARELAISLSTKKARELYGAMGQSNSDAENIDVVRDFLETYAENRPDEFLRLTKDNSAQTKALVKIALEKSILVFDKQKAMVKWADSGEGICMVPRSGVNDIVDHTATVIEGMPNAGIIKEHISKALGLEVEQ